MLGLLLILPFNSRQLKKMPVAERTFFPMPGECLCAAVALVGVIVALWLMSSPGAPPHPMRLRGPWQEGNTS